MSMRDYPAVPENNIPAIIEWLRSISTLRRDDAKVIRNFDNRFVRGRLRTDRPAPAAFDDIADGVDKEGDIVRTSAYEYTLINDAGTLKWARFAVDVAW